MTFMALGASGSTSPKAWIVYEYNTIAIQAVMACILC